ncbi:hypothetical protein CS542_07440 [Pedobacter sp. IW39]|nr:hypothetical protein CS542_07440 [Pedobacter sp. IW39]
MSKNQSNKLKLLMECRILNCTIQKDRNDGRAGIQARFDINLRYLSLNNIAIGRKIYQQH